jgi:hypothetical protein
MYKKLSEAVIALINDYGDDGGGNLFAIEINESYSPVGSENITVPSKNADLRWITIFAKDNKYISLKPYNFHFYCNSKFLPIFNLKLSLIGEVLQGLFCGSRGLITLGKNTSIICNVKSNADRVGYLITGTIEAKYGLHIQTCTALFAGCGLINKGNIRVTKTLWSNFLIQARYINMYNTVINIDSDNTSYKGIFDICTNAESNLKNVTSIDRVDKKIGLKARGNSKVLMENCNFTSSQTVSGYDITISKESCSETNNEIHLKNTTGSTNIILNKKTRYGIIRQS